MEQLINLAKGVIIVALRDLILNTPGNGFKHQGTPYIDDKDNLLFSNIKKEMINIEIVKWFESDSREQYSFLHWNNYAGLNPNCIKKYVNKLRQIYEGLELKDEIKEGPNVKPSHKSKKWMNV